ncbi:hypothetical protein FLACOL_02442 [Flavobacterium columnare]|uniref:YceI family protein n=2 Tax=Flavobacterium TaxID=237 RepID=A0A2N9PDH8_9FLAO|nr:MULTISPECIES: YceI family protein [Flavobacterium]QYS88734.1 YceI family protein [Flavobacterium davisii]RVU91901.1 YceI family protein [Flavobacterium columnare]SPE78426.1 hypothetical protein FLACOL_02442 [Flavobacterium columnare]
MKILKSFALAILVTVGGIFTTSAQTSKKVDASKSKVLWLAKKFGGQHDGDIKLKEGQLIFNGKELKGGNFTVDMTTINTLDLQGEWKNKLDIHLKDGDFFAVDKFPTSTLVFKKIGKKSTNMYAVEADLTIKGITNPIKFDLITNKGVANATLMVDRTKYDVKYASKNFGALADKAIDDEFELKVQLKY